MDDNDESDSDVEILRKRKLNVLEDEDTDQSDEEENDDEEDADDDDDDDDDDDGDESESEGDEESDNSDDNPLADDIANDQCAICLMEFTDQKIGVPNMCTHVFCLGCIQEWAKNINTCPVDRKVFYTIAVKKGKNGVTLEEIKVEDRTQAKDEEEYEDPTTCEICDTGDREDRMLLCDGCDRGFHLECLTPPLDSVPEEEWFCRDCFIDRSQDNTQELDTIDYSQHAIAFSDEEMPTFEPQSLPHAGGRISSNSRASTSQRRARTVATSRRRRQTSQATEENRQSRGRSRKRKKRAKKTKSSETGTSTVTSRQKKKRKRRRRKKRRKARSNEYVHQSTRYLLPREMEPTATFSLFGSDYDLEYLPVIETPVVTSKQPSPPRISTSSNPDVLGSIFSGLNTLHSDSLSVDNNGRLKIEESKTANQSLKKSPVSGTSTRIASTSNKDTTASSSSASSHSCCAKNMFGPCHKNMCKQSNDQSIENSNESETASRKFIAEKRLKHFGGSVSASTFARPKVDLAPSAKNRNFSSEFHPARIPTLKCKKSKLPTSNLATCNSSLGLSGAELNASQRSLASYKIPRKNPTSATSSSKSTSTSTSTSNLTATKGKSVGPIILKSCTKSRSPIKSSQSTIRRKNVRFSDAPEESSGILHLPPREVHKSPVVKTAVHKDDTSGKCENRDPSTSSITSSILPNAFNVSNADTSQTQAKVGLRFASKKPGKVDSSSSTSYPSTTQGFPKVAMQSKAKIASNEENAHRNPLHNLTTAQTVQTTNIEPSRPVAVVHPTKIDENNSREASQDAEAAKRRKEGIERLQRKQAICEEVKRALKPYYAHREISKEDYKYIYTRAFEKISESLLPVVSHGVAKLVRHFVKKLKGHQNNARRQTER